MTPRGVTTASRLFPRGSEWRKWDLHLHPPGTKLNNAYPHPREAGLFSEVLDQFCERLEKSDVQVFGITDYFSADGFLKVATRYNELYPNSEKVLLPNIEMRLNETVNGDNQDVHLHLIFRPNVEPTILRRLLSELRTTTTDAGGRRLRCSELTERRQFEAATVTRDDIQHAIDETFGAKTPRDQNLLVVVPANNDGIRATPGARRRENLADEIDKFTDAFFGSSGNSAYYLRTDRYGADALESKPKPVFACCDAHSFDQLDEWLGNTVERQGTRKQTTWIKADPTFEGLQQTLVEPEHRVRIQASRPDTKEPYKVISAVHFDGVGFPETILLSSNLAAIIGSRSSGKSALLAYIAHAIDAQYTIEQQVASGAIDAGNAGPAAALRWEDVSHIRCTVEWFDPAVTTGKIVYIPQNSLFAVSGRPEEITEKIQPVLCRMDSGLKKAHQRMQADIMTSQASITVAVSEWFRLAGRINEARLELRDLGDPMAITSTRDALAAKVVELRAASALSEDDAAKYQAVVDQLSSIASRRAVINQESSEIAPYMARVDDQYATTGVSVDVRLTPLSDVFPRALATRLTQITRDATLPLTANVSSAVIAYQMGLDEEDTRLRAEERLLQTDNADLIARNRANAELDEAVSAHQRQDELLKEIELKRHALEELEISQTAQVDTITQQRANLSQYVDDFTAQFESVPRRLDEMVFGVEAQITTEALQAISGGFNRQENTAYFARSSELVRIEVVLREPATFLASLRDGAQKVRVGSTPPELAARALSVAPDVRFIAMLENDRIGGFQPSSMTPGKQALFALSLILNESEETWPLLIDQPEDDLDSRSIYDTIVPYLVRRKRDRQILMVTHDANLVIGADSEQVIIANRHGNDRKNRNDQEFAYLTGSLEYSSPEVESEFTLETCGVREHACKILDGGETAFQKRRDKYKI